jgi:predicted permease
MSAIGERSPYAPPGRLAMQTILATLRGLRSQKGLSVLAVLTLALGIGAATAIYSFLSGLLLESIAVERPDEVRVLWGNDTAKGHPHVELSWRDFQEIERRNRTLESVAIVSSVNLDLTLERAGTPRVVDGVMVSGSFFPLLGTRPWRGRLFRAADDQPDQPLRGVISHRLWRTVFAGDDGVIGRTVRVSGTPVEILGVLPPRFDFPRNADFYGLIQPGGAPDGLMATIGVYIGLARPRAGVADAAVAEDLRRISQDLAKLYPAENETLRFQAEGFLETLYGRMREALWLLFAAVCVVMLIACANVAALLVGRTLSRTRDFAVRSSLGASPARLVGQVVLESLLLGLAATLAGVWLARVILQALLAAAPAEIPNLANIGLSLPVLGFTAALATLCILLVTVAPSLFVLRVKPRAAMQQESGAVVGSRGGRRATRWLIGAEVGLATLLVLLSGLLLRSSQNWMALDPGFDPSGVLSFRITLQDPAYGPQPARRQYYGRVLDAVRGLPGVESAGMVLLRPLSGTVGWDTRFVAETQDPEAWKTNPVANYQAISPQYFRTMRIPLLAGRDFEQSDVEGRAPVVILNESAARQYFGGANAVGRRLKMGRIDGKTPWSTVVGVVKDVRYREWASTRVDLYIPYQQRAQHRSDFVVRTTGDPRQLQRAVEQAVLAIDPKLPPSQMRAMDELVGDAFSQPRFQSGVMSLFGVTSLLLCGIGVYGVLLFRVLGLAAAALVARSLESLLFGVSPMAPGAYAAASVLTLAFAFLCGILPARLATQASPGAVLRNQ